MRYLKAIWPAPCRGEIGARYAADQRRCLSLPPPGWAGTVDEFDASPLKDLYFTPQLGEIILGTGDHTPGRPTNLRLTPARSSVLVRAWPGRRPPHTHTDQRRSPGDVVGAGLDGGPDHGLHRLLPGREHAARR